jgi:predicted nucleic acid-binding protein
VVARRQAIADTSLFAGLETERVDTEALAELDFGVSVITLAHGLPVATQDTDYDAMPDLAVIRL